MPEFKQATIEDKEEVSELLKASGGPSLEYNFTTLFIWQEQFSSEIAVEDDILFVRSGNKRKSYLFPCGRGDIKAAVEKMLTLSDEPLFLHSVNEEQKQFLEEHFPERFDFRESRDAEDYIYSSESLASLTGKKLSAKRNHINRFLVENPEWSYEPITAENIAEAKAMHAEWCSAADIADRPGLAEETAAVKKAFEYYSELALTGGLIRAGGRVVAFSMGDPLNDSTYLVHIEKAFNSVNGAYPLINREFVRHNCADYEFVDREDDAGDEGLRRAKLSYRPVRLVTKYYARERR